MCGYCVLHLVIGFLGGGGEYAPLMCACGVVDDYHSLPGVSCEWYCFVNICHHAVTGLHVVLFKDTTDVCIRPSLCGRIGRIITIPCSVDFVCRSYVYCILCVTTYSMLA